MYHYRHVLKLHVMYKPTRFSDKSPSSGDATQTNMLYECIIHTCRVLKYETATINTII